MHVSINFSVVRHLALSDLVKRFALGALITAVAGVIADVWGPGVGGLFLAFPAILPMALTLISDDQEARKDRHGLHGVIRGRKAAALDAFGALMGTAGLGGFALIVQRLTLHNYHAMALVVATLVWCAVSSALWWLRHH